jgi:hypothetical protein
LSRFLALDPDGHGLFLVSGSLKKGVVTIEQTIGQPGGPDDGPLSAANAAQYGIKLKNLIAQADIKPAPVYVILGRDRVIFKDVTFPKCPPEVEPAIVRGQALKELVDAVGDVSMDYVPTGTNAEGMKQAQVLFIRKDLLLAVRTMCETAGLKIVGVTPRSYALMGAVPKAAAELTNAVATVWDGGGEFIVTRGRAMLFARTLSPAASENDAALAAELKRNLAVYAGQRNASAVETLYLAESSRLGAARRVGGTLPVPVEALDPLLGSTAGDLIPEALRGRFAAPVGLLQLRTADENLPINFTVPRQPKADSGKLNVRYLLAGLAVMLLLGALGFLGYLEVGKAENRLAELRNEKTSLEKQLTNFDPDIKLLAAVDEFEGRNIVWLDELYDLADRIPDVDKVKITSLEGKAITVTKVAPKPGQAPPDPRTIKPSPAATFTIQMRTADEPLSQDVTDKFKNDKFYTNTIRTRAAQGDAGRTQLFVLTTQVLHRLPTDYLRRLNLTFPKSKRDVETPEDDTAVGGF